MLDLGELNMGYFLMIKTINENGLKYLCKCIDTKDPYRYKGSGVFWRKILKSKPDMYTISTEILGHYETNEQLARAGAYFSEQFAVVESSDWANCIPEVGDGGATVKGKIRAHNTQTGQEKFFDNENSLPPGWVRGIIRYRTERAKELTAQYHRGKKRSEHTKQKMRDSTRKNRITLQCTYCDRQITPQNIKRHMEKTHEIYSN